MANDYDDTEVEATDEEKEIADPGSPEVQAEAAAKTADDWRTCADELARALRKSLTSRAVEPAAEALAKYEALRRRS